MRDGHELRRPNTWETIHGRDFILIVRWCYILVMSMRARPVNANSVAQRSECPEPVVVITCKASSTINMSRKSIV